MKKLILTCLVLLTILCMGTGCEKTKKLPEPADEDTQEKLPDGHFEQRTSFMEKEDGWVYFIQEDISYEDGVGQTDISYNFDGVNLKYANLEDYYVPVMEDGKEVDRLDGIPMLSLNKKYKGELQEINQCLLEKKDMIGKLTEKDLAELQGSQFDKKEIAELFNRLEKSKRYHNKSDDLSKYIYLPEYDALSRELDNGDKVQLMYFCALQGLARVRIEVIDAKGAYWSDEVKKGKAGKEKEETVHFFDKVSKKIVEQQSLDLEKQMKKENDSEYADALWKLLDQMEQEADRAAG